MAITFPTDPGAQTPVNTFSPSSTPVANSANGNTYVWNGTAWTTQQANLEQYVNVAGDVMTGTLTVPTVDATTLNAGNIVLPDAGGITFGTTYGGSGTGTSKVLDDYEEGTWTPQDGSGAGLVFVTETDGHYVKIGNFFHCWGRVTYPVTTNTNAAQISNLPFTVSGDNVIYSGATSVQNTGYANLRVMQEGNRIQFRQENNASFGNHQVSDKFIYFTFQGYTGTV